MLKRYIGDCYACSVCVFRNDPIFNRPLPYGPWYEVACYQKGPIGGMSGFYYHVIVDTYSCYPENLVIPDTKFETLKPVLEEVWARHGYPETLIHNGGPLYNSAEWFRYVEGIECKMDQSTPGHPQTNGMCDRMMANLVKITHAGIERVKNLLVYFSHSSGNIGAHLIGQ